MAGDPYCGKCHTWMWPSHRSKMLGFDQDIVWVCGCPPGKPDMSKDPNCHNSNHAHHDPQSPLVLSNRSIRNAEEAHDTGVYDKAWQARTGEYRSPADDEGTICGHERVDGRCNFWGCPARRAKAAEHVAHNGSPCDECGALITDEPEKGFVARDGPTDRPGSPFADHPYHVAVLDSATGEMLGWRPLREPKIDEETRAELDAIPEEANEKVED